MSAQHNKELAQTVYSLFSQNEFAAALRHATEDVEVVFVPAGQLFNGHEGFQQFMQGFKTAFPNVTLEVTRQVANDSQVVNEFIARGVQTGPLMTPAGAIPATNNYAEWPVCEVWEVRDGKVASIHNYQDMATMLRQLGLLNEPAPLH